MYTVKYTSRTKLKARACAHHGANKPEHVSRAPCWAKICSKTHTTNCVGRTASAIFAPFYDSRKKTRKKAEAAARQPTGRSSSPPNSPSISNGSFQPQAPHDRHVPARRLRHGLLAHRVRRDRHLRPRQGLGRDVPPGYPLDAFFDITSQNATPVSLYVLALGAMLTQVMDDDGEMTVSEVSEISEISEIPIRQPTRRSLLAPTCARGARCGFRQ